MKCFFSVGCTTLMIVMMSAVGRETAAQNPQAGQAPQGYAQPTANGPTSQRPVPLTQEQVAKIEANLARLSPEDRQLVEAQVFCPIMVRNRLGIMGPPMKVMIKDQPVFVCCKGCVRKALANPEATLARVAQLKAWVEAAEIETSLSKLNPEDRRLAEAQGYCPVMRDNRLGVMGPPVKVMIGNQPVFLCCAGCKRRAMANPAQTLAIVADLRAKVAEEAARKASVEQRSTQR